MNRDFGNLIGCFLLALIALIFLPVILLLLVIQVLTGRRVAYMNRFRSKPPTPDPDPTPGPDSDPMREVRASEEIIDVEVVDLPDDPPEEPSRLKQHDDNR